MTCHGLNCTCTKLIEAHIVPRAFARDIKGASKHNIKASIDNAHPTQHGVFDPAILCGSCDSHLGTFDDYGVEVSRRFEREHIRDGVAFLMRDVDGDRLAKFALAVIWRASISRRPECREVSLGPYEDVARDVLFGAQALADMRSYELIVSRYDGAQAQKLYSLPSPVTNLRINSWGFACGGFRFVAKMDKRRWPDMPAAEANFLVVNGKSELRGLFVDFDGTVEHRAAVAMRLADLDRKAAKAAPRPA